MDRTVGGPLIPTLPLNDVLNQETVVQDSHLHSRMPAVCVPLHTLLNYHVCICLLAAVDCRKFIDMSVS